MKALLPRGGRTQTHPPDEAGEFRIPISRANLTPWHWNGLRGEMVTLALGTGFVLLVYVQAWKAALIVPFLILYIAKRLHAWHPFWIEIVVRLLVQPEGHQDS